ncbi:MAG: protein-glutamate O-methyltransferase CheR [Clostridiales bacterium]|nr:protein-glutamate O-methyltransferase CheR [Clostridiales bacterium]
MDYEGFKKDIFSMTSINLSYYKEKQMKRRIDSLIKKNGFDLYEDYVKALKSNTTLFNEFINYLTINVSEFYRNPEQWEVLKNDIFPMLLKKNRKLKIWSAACSTGDEPYTLVMVLNNFVPLNEISIYATDIDKEALRKAKNGVYSEKSLEKLPKEYLTKHFTKNGDSYIVNNDVKSRVEFVPHNLLKDEYQTNCDLIVCRNVLIYFTEEAKANVYNGFSKSLKTDGVLFIGSTEQIIMASKYNLNSTKTFFYVKG